MKALFIMLLACALLTACATRGPHAKQHVISAGPVAGTVRIQTPQVPQTNRFIHITGNVPRPGLYPCQNETSLLRAFALADGPGSFTKNSVLEIHRTDGSVELYSYSQIIRGSTNDPLIYPDERIHVKNKSRW